jgi:hypothetical protein
MKGMKNMSKEYLLFSAPDYRFDFRSILGTENSLGVYISAGDSNAPKVLNLLKKFAGQSLNVLGKYDDQVKFRASIYVSDCADQAEGEIKVFEVGNENNTSLHNKLTIEITGLIE